MTLNEGEKEPGLRLWPGVAAVILQWLAWLGLPSVAPEATGFGVIGGLLGGLAVLLWWVFFSRAPRFERWGAVVLMTGAVAATPWVLHESIARGMMGLMFAIYAIPILSLGLVGWAAATRRLAAGPRRATLVATVIVACGGWALLRTEGITGEGRSQFAWRWTPDAEQRLMTRQSAEPEVSPAAAATEDARGEERLPQAGGDLPASPAARVAPLEVAAAPRAAEPTHAGWPGFRGPSRDGIVSGVRIETDWASSPPVELWRRPVGPGWSSFAVGGEFVYTQEQRGDHEVVSCYRLATGKPVWSHRDAARFWESNAGAGPRATPALSGGRLYSFGATGILNALDALDGSVLWSRNVASDTGAKIPGWGFASSPWVAGDTVIVSAGGALAAYGAAGGEPRWFGPAGGGGYSSPHWLTLEGVPQVLLLTGAGAVSVSPADGALLWKYEWPGDGIVQPASVAGDVLIGTGSGLGGGGTGIRRVAVTHKAEGWTVEERWTSTGLKPYFNDFVVHEGHAFGFDGSILACIDLADGKRKWKGGRYGHGQLLLLSDQDLLLVLSEQGELALVSATPDGYSETARFPAIEGKTWNHPVLAGDILLARNGEQMVAFRLTIESR